MDTESCQEEDEVQHNCVRLLNEAALMTTSDEKVTNLYQVQELIIHRSPALLDGFLDEVTAFQTDSSADVRRAVISFIEHACETDPEVIPRVVVNLAMMLQDTQAVSVVKRSIQAIIRVYRKALQWLCVARKLTDVMRSAWEMLCELKLKILALIEHDNDGVRTMAVKFIESVVLLQTYSEISSDAAESSAKIALNDFCLDHVPVTLRVARPRRLESEARNFFSRLVAFHGSSYISSVNLIACMSALVQIARVRVSFAPHVLMAVECLHANLPPTLSKSQVSSVRKHMKIQLLSLISQQLPPDLVHNMSTLLTDLGAIQADILKALPTGVGHQSGSQTSTSSADQKTTDTSMTVSTTLTQPTPLNTQSNFQSARKIYAPSKRGSGKREHSIQSSRDIDVTQKWVVERLSAECASEIVLYSMQSLPDQIPSLFCNNFTPIAAAGCRSQIRHVSRLLASQLVHAGVGQRATISDCQQVDLECRENSTDKPTKNGIHTSNFDYEDQGEDEEMQEDDDVVVDGYLSGNTSHRMSHTVKREKLNQSYPDLNIQDDEMRSKPDMMYGDFNLADGNEMKLTMTGDSFERQIVSKSSNVTLVPSGQTQSGILARTGDILEMARPISSDACDISILQSLQRVLDSEYVAIMSHHSTHREKLFSTIISHFVQDKSVETLDKFLRSMLQVDIRKPSTHVCHARAELCLAWIYEEYAFSQGFSRARHFILTDTKHCYEFLLCRIVNILVEMLTTHSTLQPGNVFNSQLEIRKNDQLALEDDDTQQVMIARNKYSNHTLLSRVLLESPSIPHGAIMHLKDYLLHTECYMKAADFLIELSKRRPPLRLSLAQVLIDVASYVPVNEDVLARTIQTLLHLHDMYTQVGDYIEKTIVEMLRQCAFDGKKTDDDNIDTDLNKVGQIQAYVQIFLSILSRRGHIIDHLASLYVHADSHLKRFILRTIEPPIREMAMDSHHLLDLIEKCPAGADTLITRIIHLLTTRIIKSSRNHPREICIRPSSELVCRVRSLYTKQRIHDVRLIVPIVNGLSRFEINEVLPKLISLNPIVVREVFNRLLNSTNVVSACPSDGERMITDDHDIEDLEPTLTPEELLIDMHRINDTECDLRSQIRAVSMCLSLARIYTPEVLTSALITLLEDDPLPVLYMRTVIQAFTLHTASLLNLVINILHRLVIRQVWSWQPKPHVAWKGFVKCCQRAVPSSLSVLLALPANAFSEVVKMEPDLRALMCQNVHNLTMMSDEQKTILFMKSETVLQDVKPCVEQPSNNSNSSATIVSRKFSHRDRTRTEKIKVKQEPLDDVETIDS